MLKAKFNYQVFGMLIVLSILMLSVQVSGAANAQTENVWAMTMQLQKDGQSVQNTTFAPFDQVGLVANVTYGNVGQSSVLVTFKVQDPLGNSSITRVVSTDSNGLASFSFHIPFDNQNQSSIGTWKASATIQTTNGKLQQNVTFSTKYTLDIASIKLLDSPGQEKTTFQPGELVTVRITVNNIAQTQTVNVSINMLNSTSALLNQTVIINEQIENNSTQVQASLQIPNNTAEGTATINGALFSGNYQDTDIPAAQNKTVSFTIAANGTEPTATPAPTSTPTATPQPQPFEVAISLFSWLLIATGFFTFTALTVFIRRKPSIKKENA